MLAIASMVFAISFMCADAESIRSKSGILKPSFIEVAPSRLAPSPPPDCCGGLLEQIRRPGPPIQNDALNIPNMAPATEIDLLANGDQQSGPKDFQLFRNSVLGSESTGGGNTSEILEPSVGSIGKTIFQAGNWYAARSLDHGSTWGYISPYTLFPVRGVFAGGFCCDQRVTHSRTHKMLIWYLQYMRSGNTEKDQGGVRIVVARSEADLRKGAWTYYSFSPKSFGITTGEFFDFPHLQVSDRYVYATSNMFSSKTNLFTRAIIFRVPLKEMNAAKPIRFDYWMPSTKWSEAASIAPTNGATDTMYFASVISTSQIRMFSVGDDSNSLSSQVIGGLSNTYFGLHTSIGPDGNNWTGRADPRVQAAWVSKREIGFMWNSAQGGERPQPFIRAVKLSRSNNKVIAQPDLWSKKFAWHYPAVAVNARGDLGGVAFAGGPISPETRVLIDDSATNGWDTFFTAAGTNGGASRWGDFLGVQPDDQYPNTWIATGFTLDGPTVLGRNAGIRPRFFWFGRRADSPFARPVIAGGGASLAGGDSGYFGAGSKNPSFKLAAAEVSKTPESFQTNSIKSVVAADGLKYLEITVRKLPQRFYVRPTVEVSPNLIDWYSGRNHTSVMADDAFYLTVRDKTPFRADGKRYIRVK